MTQGSISSEIAKAVPVVIGGLLAIVGGAVAQLLTHHLAVKREQASLQRERLERIVKAVFANDQWLTTKQEIMVFTDEEHTEPSPLNEARMLADLYYPELSQSITAVGGAEIPLVKIIWKERVARMRDPSGWPKTYNSQPFLDGYKEYRSTAEIVVEKCRDLLPR